MGNPGFGQGKAREPVIAGSDRGVTGDLPALDLPPMFCRARYWPPTEEEVLPTNAIAEKGLLVVARFLDGTCLKGTTQDFAPNKTEFHLHEGGNEGSRAVTVSAESLKALFFVKSFEGNREHRDEYALDGGSGQGGRKIRVRFTDGEVMAGFTVGYNPHKQGFFLVPADQDGNNARVYVLNKAVAKVEWA